MSVQIAVVAGKFNLAILTAPHDGHEGVRFASRLQRERAFLAEVVTAPRRVPTVKATQETPDGEQVDGWIRDWHTRFAGSLSLSNFGASKELPMRLERCDVRKIEQC
jgi:type II secretory pathway component PulM